MLEAYRRLGQQLLLKSPVVLHASWQLDKPGMCLPDVQKNLFGEGEEELRSLLSLLDWTQRSHPENIYMASVM